MSDRDAVYDAIDSERDYQDLRWNKSEGRRTEVTAWLVYIRDYAEEALHWLSREHYTTSDPKALENIRKITAMGVACMEEHGAPMRKNYCPKCAGVTKEVWSDFRKTTKRYCEACVHTFEGE